MFSNHKVIEVSSGSQSDLVNLPDEIKFEILKHVDNLSQVKALGKTCWTFFKFTKDQQLKRFFTYDYSQANEPHILNDKINNITAMTISSDDEVIAVTTTDIENNLHLLNAKTGETINIFAGRRNFLVNYIDYDVELHFTKNNKYLLVSYHSLPDPEGISWESRINAKPGYAYIDVWNVATGEKVHTFNDLTDNLNKPPHPHINVTSNFEFVVTFKENQFPYHSYSDSRVFICDINNKMHTEYKYENNKIDSKNHSCSYLSPNGKWLISISNISYCLFTQYDFQTGRKIKAFNLPEPSSELQFIDDDTLVYIHHPSYSGINKFRCTNQPILNANHNLIITYNLPNKTYNSISAEELFHDDTLFDYIHFTKLTKNCLAIVNNKKNKILIWDLNLKKCINTVHSPYTQNLLTTSDGNALYILKGSKLNRIRFPNFTEELTQIKDKAYTI